MAYIPNPNADIPGEPSQIWRDDVDSSAFEHPGHARFLVAVTGLALVPWLYPITAALVLGVGLIASEIADAMGLPGIVYPVAVLVATLPLLVVLMRTEQRLGTFIAYRWLRHGMRVLGPATLLNLGVRDGMGLPEPSIGTFIADTLNDSSLLGGTLVVIVLAQGLLWLAGWVRDDWHASLEMMRLRSTAPSE